MSKVKSLLVLTLSLLLCLFTTTAFAGEMQKSLLDKLQQPGEKLTRAEYVAMLATAAELPAPTGTVTLPLDVPANAWYASDMKAALAAKVISGTSSDAINPNQPITKAQAVAMLARVLAVPSVEAPGSVGVPVPSDHWAFVPYSWLVKEGLVDNTFNPDEAMTPAEGAALLEKAFGTAWEAYDLMEKSQAAHLGMKTVRGTGDMSMTMKANPAVPVQGMPANIGMNAKFTYEMNQEQGLRQQFNMTITGLPQAVPPMEFEQYMVAEGMFMKMNNPLTGEMQWIKMPEGSVPNFTELMKQQSEFMQFPKELQKYFHYRLLGEKKVADKTYYEVSFIGNIPNLSEFMAIWGGQSGLNQEMMKGLEQSSSMIKGIGMAGKILVDKNTLLSHQLNATSVIAFADKFEGQSFPIQSLTASFNFLYKDYGAEVDITLPAEAAKAEALPLTQTAPAQPAPAN